MSLRTGELHVITTRAEQDAGVWLVVDGLRDIGRSGGIDGAASTLDLTVRAAAALAEHHVRTGDRVGLLVVAADPSRVPLGSGPRHLQRIHAVLARIRTDGTGAQRQEQAYADGGLAGLRALYHQGTAAREE